MSAFLDGLNSFLVGGINFLFGPIMLVVFFGTGIPTIVMVLRQKRDHDDVLFVDASKGFAKVGKNNQLRARDIRKIVDAVTKRIDIPKF